MRVTGQEERALSCLQTTRCLSIEGPPQSGKRFLARTLVESLGGRAEYFLCDGGRLQQRPLPNWLGQKGRGQAKGSPIRVVERAEALASCPPLLEQALGEESGGAVLLLTRRRMPLREGLAHVELGPLPIAEILAMKPDVGLSTQVWLDLARRNGFLPGLTCYAAEQLQEFALPLALQRIQRRLREWQVQVWEGLLPCGRSALQALQDSPHALTSEQLQNPQGLEELREHFLVEESAGGIWARLPYRRAPQQPSQGEVATAWGDVRLEDDAQLRQARRLWSQAQGVSLANPVAEGELELLYGHWGEARRLFRYADMNDIPEGWAGCILTTLLMGQVRKAREAMQRPGEWKASRRYPFLGLKALLAYLSGEPLDALENLRLMPSAPIWGTHLLKALCLGVLQDFEGAWQAFESCQSGNLLQQAWSDLVAGWLRRGQWQWDLARRHWDSSLKAFAGLGHFNGMALAQVERLEMDENLRRPLAPADLQTWQCLAVQLGNAEVEARVRLLQSARGDQRSQGWGKIYERWGLPLSHFAYLWQQVESQSKGESVGEAGLYIRFLGSLRLEGPLGVFQQSDWPTRKAAILFCLISQTSRPLSDEVLMAELWPEASAQQARMRLRTTLSQVRRALRQVAGEDAADSLVRSRKSKTLVSSLRCNSDVMQLRLLVQQAQQMGLDRRSADRLWEFALSHPHRVYLESFREDWTDPLRREVEQLWTRLFSLLGEFELAQRRLEQARRAVLSGLEVDELDEGLVRLKIEVLLAQGRRCELVRWCAERAQAFSERLGLVPDYLRQWLDLQASDPHGVRA